MKGAFETGVYRNVFAEMVYTEEEIENKIKESFNTVFYGGDDEKFFYKTGDDMGYLMDTGNNDARTEGMSYGMMMCVQIGWKEEFDCLWKWAKTYMYNYDGYHKGYFGWSCRTSGEKNSNGPAPDGEEFFAMALFFASNRWGDGEGIFNYSKEARQILHDCLHKGEENPGVEMWNLDNKLIRFVPNCGWTDPSYHLPHFYELFALWADEEDREFWAEAAKASREYLKKACHPVTGLAAEYANYDGTPYVGGEKFIQQFGSRHDWFFSDSYRVAANIGIDYEWFAADEWNVECADNIQKFFCVTVGNKDFMTYEIDGTVINQPALHPVAIIATNAMASLAARGSHAKECVELFWNTPLRTGDRRYYDNCLYLFALLALSGRYRIWK